MDFHADEDTAELPDALAQVLRELRCERGLTQDALAEKSGCHVNHISFLERGLRVPSLLVIFQVARGLAITPTELITRVEERLRALNRRCAVGEPSSASGTDRSDSRTTR